MEMVSRAVAKMALPSASGLIGAEVWTLAKTAIELSRSSVSKVKQVRKQRHKLQH